MKRLMWFILAIAVIALYWRLAEIVSKPMDTGLIYKQRTFPSGFFKRNLREHGLKRMPEVVYVEDDGLWYEDGKKGRVRF